MERLTERDEYGNADIIGVSCEVLQTDLTFDEMNKLVAMAKRGWHTARSQCDGGRDDNENE